jgi:1-deoxy-D-xylulose 5-phosphate reductoisomerase
VGAFLEGLIPLTDIPEITAQVIDAHDPAPVVSVVSLQRADDWARARATELIASRR